MIAAPDSWLLTLALKPALLFVAAAAACWAMRSAAAALRHAVWTAAFLGLLLLPFLSLSLPAWEPAVAPALAPTLAPARIVIDVIATGDGWRAWGECLAATLWGLGVVALLADLLIGWIQTRSLLARSTRFPAAGNEVWLSSQIALPVVCGAMSRA